VNLCKARQSAASGMEDELTVSPGATRAWREMSGRRPLCKPTGPQQGSTGRRQGTAPEALDARLMAVRLVPFLARLPPLVPFLLFTVRFCDIHTSFLSLQ
jgi:hypothetical protein